MPDWFIPPRSPALPAYIPKIPRKALPAWQELTVALTAESAVVPCTSVVRDWWTSDIQSELDAAAIACNGCTVLDQCGKYADLADIRFHVYGGRNREPQTMKGNEKK